MVDSSEEAIKLLLTVVVGGAVGSVDEVAAVTGVGSPIGNMISSLVVKVGPGLGSTPAINNMRSSVVTANRAASP